MDSSDSADTAPRSTPPLLHPTVPRRSRADGFSASVFTSDYLTHGRPLVVTDASDEWPARAWRGHVDFAPAVERLACPPEWAAGRGSGGSSGGGSGSGGGSRLPPGQPTITDAKDAKSDVTLNVSTQVEAVLLDDACKTPPPPPTHPG